MITHPGEPWRVCGLCRLEYPDGDIEHLRAQRCPARRGAVLWHRAGGRRVKTPTMESLLRHQAERMLQNEIERAVR